MAWDIPKHNLSEERRYTTRSIIIIPNVQVYIRRGHRVKKQDVTSSFDLWGVENVDDSSFPLSTWPFCVCIFKFSTVNISYFYKWRERL